MRKTLTATGLAGAMLLGSALSALAEDVTVPMKAIGIHNGGTSIGKVIASDTDTGVLLKIDLRNMPVGANWVLLGKSRSCPATLDQVEGERLGMIDTAPESTGLVADKINFAAPEMKLSDLRRHALLVVHEEPAAGKLDPLAKYHVVQVACGVAE